VNKNFIIDPVSNTVVSVINRPLNNYLINSGDINGNCLKTKDSNLTTSTNSYINFG
jgi:hypothetical protein